MSHHAHFESILEIKYRLIYVFEVVNILRGPKNRLTPECEARGC